MSKRNLLTKAKEIYSKQGLLQLIKSSLSYISRQYRTTVDKFRHVKTNTRRINLNGVTVPVEVSPIDKYLPFYQPPYPIESKREYEHTEVESLKTYAQKGDDVVVIGGGLGVTAVVASRITGGKVTVYEQSETTYRMLNRTIELNDFNDSIKTELKAVGEIAGSNFTHSLSPTVETIPPSELPYADIYEMDCEGAETAILQEMGVRPSTLLIETHDNHDIVCKILNEIGYDIVEVIDNGKGQAQSCTHVRAQLSE